MISIFKKNKSIGNKRGMTYVELIVVLSIFFIMSGVVLGNYGSFQKKIEIKNLANDIAQTILKAQKDSIAGLNGDSFIAPSKPSYGIYFDTSDDAAKAQFIYFADKNNAGYFVTPSSSPAIPINKGNKIDKLVIADCHRHEQTTPNLSIVFRRPNSIAYMHPGGNVQLAVGCPAMYSNIYIASSDASVPDAIITIESTGAISIN